MSIEHRDVARQEQLRRASRVSARGRRTQLILRLIRTSPVLTPDQRHRILEAAADIPVTAAGDGR